jgi:hypothetical protein
MGRHHKTVITSDGIDRREEGYYSTPEYVADFISKKCLELSPGAKAVLDPCAGKEELLHFFHKQGLDTDTFDLLDYGVHNSTTFEQADFLRYYASTCTDLPLLAGPKWSHHDIIIANPPYNCHEVDYIRKNKFWLGSAFSEIGCHNMYSMFMYALIQIAKPGCVIGLIVSDSFLSHTSHMPLREHIVRSCSVELVALCPTDLFKAQKADVRTCIIILRKECTQGRVEVLNRAKTEAEFRNALADSSFERLPLSDILLNSSYDGNEFIIGCPSEIRDIFSCKRIGSEFKCVTGISTGNDKKFLSKTATSEHSVPFYKNPAGRRFFCQPDAYLPNNFLEIDKQEKTFMVRNKSLLMRAGVTCSSMGVAFGACRLPENATYGVNANIICDDADAWWILGYLNSYLVSYLVRGVMLRTNMITSGYVSRIPLVKLSVCAKERIGHISKRAYSTKNSYGHEEAIEEINSIVYDEANISLDIQLMLEVFAREMLKRT